MFLKRIFTWWRSATYGTLFATWRKGHFVGEDNFGNRYYESRRASRRGQKSRWVIYKGLIEPTLIPVRWHGWLHYMYDTPPQNTSAPRSKSAKTKTQKQQQTEPAALFWERARMPNLTGTSLAHYPAGSLFNATQRPRATGDYVRWHPQGSQSATHNPLEDELKNTTINKKTEG